MDFWTSNTYASDASFRVTHESASDLISQGCMCFDEIHANKTRRNTSVQLIQL